jgi:hypothetical protein
VAQSHTFDFLSWRQKRKRRQRYRWRRFPSRESFDRCSGLGTSCSLGCFGGALGGLLGSFRQLAAEFDDFMGRQLAHEFRDVISVVVDWRRQEIKRRKAEAFGKARDGLHGNGSKAMFDARKVAFGNFRCVGKVSEGHVSFEAQFAKSCANF